MSRQSKEKGRSSEAALEYFDLRGLLFDVEAQAGAQLMHMLVADLEP
jgi:hypothetical protein